MKPQDRCSFCGQFVDITSPKIGSTFIPDTHFTSESTEFFHLTCLKRYDDFYDLKCLFSECKEHSFYIDPPTKNE